MSSQIVPEAPHGTAAGFLAWGCRCWSCERAGEGRWASGELDTHDYWGEYWRGALQALRDAYPARPSS